MMTKWLGIKGGKTLVGKPSGDSKTAVIQDILIDNGVIVEVGEVIAFPPGAEVLDVQGCFVLPGFVDLHCHMREPGDEESETIHSASIAGANGGFCCVVAMPNTTPAIDGPDMVELIRSKSTSALIDVEVAGAISKAREGKALSEMNEMARLGVKIFTDDGCGVQDSRLMLSAMQYSLTSNSILAQHCEDSYLASGGHLHDGDVSSVLGVQGIPNEGEEAMAYRDILLAKKTGARLHLMHMSTQRVLEIVQQARDWGVDITCEVTPHHLSLTHESVKSLNPNLKVNPPLRTANDCHSLIEGLIKGQIDAIATDHAPHHPDKKDVPFEEASFGMLGLETAFSVVFTLLTQDKFPASPELIKPSSIDTIQALAIIQRAMSETPSKIAGVEKRHGGPIEPGRVANLAIIDPSRCWTVAANKLASKSRNTPFDGIELVGKVVHTIAKGKLVVSDGGSL